ncbi:MAG TPA: hypothetical protein PKE27_00105 [Povalibacter sp.]|uniref:hypothetical protein n=1 Tax=Povalibacter sp. TaxID=1962978 RepID=UPI002BEE2ACF|nr:hypothetical protein [Povalibacter sp.]HMN42948.1 hypothetical protein [Povalibacter sp.]
MANRSASAAEWPEMTNIEHPGNDQRWCNADGGGWVDALERAWPGVRVLRLDFEFDNRQDHSERSGRMTVNLNVSGIPDALIAAGLVSRTELDSLPPCGVRGGRRKITRSKATGRIRVESFIRDNDEKDFPAFNVLVSALSPLIWKP